MKIAVVNDSRSQIPGTKTIWDDLVDWLDAEFVGDVPFDLLADKASQHECDILIRNCSYFRPITTQAKQISLLQDIFLDGPQRAMQEEVCQSSHAVIWNSAFTASQYGKTADESLPRIERVIPLPVDFSLFEPMNPMGLQQALGLPDGCVLWVGACQGAAGQVKGWDIFIRVVRANPDLPFVAVFKDRAPDSVPPNLRTYERLPHAELVKVMGACRVGLCTSRTESQHLAGIEMGACGLPLVVPPVGCYWQRKDWPGCEVLEHTPDAFTQGIRASIGKVAERERQWVSNYWRKEFDRPVIRSTWTRLVEEVECSGQS